MLSVAFNLYGTKLETLDSLEDFKTAELKIFSVYTFTSKTLLCRSQFRTSAISQKIKFKKFMNNYVIFNNKIL